MDIPLAMLLGEANRHKTQKVFDWDKAARLIKENNATDARAGLSEDWYWTAGTILENGEPDMDSYTYLASTWATPELEIDDEFYECYVMADQTDWDSETKWPESALKILKGLVND